MDAKPLLCILGMHASFMFTGLQLLLSSKLLCCKWWKESKKYRN